MSLFSIHGLRRAGTPAAIALLVACSGGESDVTAPGGNGNTGGNASFSYETVNPPSYSGPSGTNFQVTNQGVYLEHDDRISKYVWTGKAWSYSEPVLANAGPRYWANPWFDKDGYDYVTLRYDLTQDVADRYGDTFRFGGSTSSSIAMGGRCCQWIAQGGTGSAGLFVAGNTHVFYWDFNRNNANPWFGIDASYVGSDPTPASMGEGITAFSAARDGSIALVGTSRAIYGISPNVGTTRFSLTSYGTGPVNQIHDDGTHVWFTYGTKLLRYAWATEQVSLFADIAANVSLGFGDVRFRVTTDGVYTSYGKVFNPSNGDLLGTWMPPKPAATTANFDALLAYNAMITASDLAVHPMTNTILLNTNSGILRVGRPGNGYRAPWTDPTQF